MALPFIHHTSLNQSCNNQYMARIYQRQHVQHVAARTCMLAQDPVHARHAGVCGLRQRQRSQSP